MSNDALRPHPLHAVGIDAAVDPSQAATWLAAVGAQEAGSLRLAEVLGLDEVLCALTPHLGPLLREGFDLLPGQCWVRRARPPHSWHQDGALHARFEAGEALLPIVTCWLALTDCGVDAPSLEWVEPPLDRLLAPAELAEAAVRARHAPGDLRQGVFRAGDALVFGGGLLHRTHLTPAMQRPRTSLELRFVARGCASPRLAAEARRPLIG